MLRIEIGIEDLEQFVERAWQAVPMRVEGGRLLAKKFGAELALGPARIDVARGELVLPLEVVSAIGGLFGRAAARGVVFAKLEKLAIPELQVDAQRSVLLLDLRKLVARLPPQVAGHNLRELAFNDAGPRGSVLATLASVS